MNVQLRPTVSVIEWSAVELVKLRERLELSMKKCWEINEQDDEFMRGWYRDRDDGAPTVELITQFFDSAHIQTVESGDLGAAFDIEAGYLAWRVFRGLAAHIDDARMD